MQNSLQDVRSLAKGATFVTLVIVCIVATSEHSTIVEWFSVVAAFFTIIRDLLNGPRTQGKITTLYREQRAIEKEARK